MKLDPNRFEGSVKPFQVSAKDIRWLTDLAFLTRKRMVRIHPCESVSFFNTFWDGGSKNSYKAVKLETGETASPILGSSPWNAIAEGQTVKLEPGIVIVEESVFCGKFMSLTVHIHPDNLVKFLPEENISQGPITSDGGF